MLDVENKTRVWEILHLAKNRYHKKSPGSCADLQHNTQIFWYIQVNAGEHLVILTSV